MTFAIFAAAIIFGFEQNQYFGWNATPHSDAELIADGINLLLFALAFLSWRAA